MHRTTIEIDEKLLQSIKGICVKKRKKMKHFVLELIRSGFEVYIENNKQVKPNGFVSWHTSKNLLPKEIDPADRSSYQSSTDRLFK